MLEASGAPPGAVAEAVGGGARPGRPWSLWRYSAALPPAASRGAEAVSMGEGLTPLVPDGDGRWLKLDFLQPTLSFKDRGAAVLISAVAAAGAGRVVVDSSGNAGSSIAAYAARAGIAAEVFVPGSTSEAKRSAIARYGASITLVAGSRADTAAAARDRVAETGAVYASHVYQPLFLQGTKTCAYEIWEQAGGRPPGTVVFAAGNGTMALGLSIGFAELAEAGLAPGVPRLVAVQAERCAPLLGAAPVGATVAEGIAVASPPRGGQILAALDATGGAVITAAEATIGPARAELARRGVDVEPTSAAVWAAWQAWPGAASAPQPVVLVLGGAGLKSS